MSERDDAPRPDLEARIRELEEENRRLQATAQDVASANVNAAMQLVEMTEQRSRELEKKNEEIERALAAAEHASQQKSRFLATMSHELRTPISGIIGMAELLGDSGLGTAQLDQVEAILSTAESFLDLVNQLLDFSKAEAQAIEFENVEYDLWRANETIAHLLHVSAQSKDVDLHFYLDPKLPREVIGDPLRTRQIVLNLGANAIKFTSRGAVAVWVEKHVDERGDAWIQWTVHDTGCGFDEQTGERIFDPFVQADASTTRKHGGTGLGLAISRHLVETMGGAIGCSSEPERGSTFTVRLPLVTSAPAEEPTAGPTPQRLARVVAARPATLVMLAEHLPLLGYRLIDEDDDEHADLLVLEAAFDCERALQRLRDREPQVPAVLVACPGANLPDERHAELGVIGVLQQPPRPTQLLKLLRAAEGEVGVEVGGDNPFAGKRALAVDDSLINLRVLALRLRKFGCEVVTAEDGEQAVAQFEAQRFDVVLLDCQMPIIDGYDAAGRMRAFERANDRPRTPIIALTADGTSSNIDRCREAGMDDFALKPIRTPQVEALMTRWLLEDADAFGANASS